MGVAIIVSSEDYGKDGTYLTVIVTLEFGGRGQGGVDARGSANCCESGLGRHRRVVGWNWSSWTSLWVSMSGEHFHRCRWWKIQEEWYLHEAVFIETRLKCGGSGGDY